CSSSWVYRFLEGCFGVTEHDHAFAVGAHEMFAVRRKYAGRRLHVVISGVSPCITLHIVEPRRAIVADDRQALSVGCVDDALRRPRKVLPWQRARSAEWLDMYAAILGNDGQVSSVRIECEVSNRALVLRCCDRGPVAGVVNDRV